MISCRRKFKMKHLSLLVIFILLFVIRTCDSRQTSDKQGQQLSINSDSQSGSESDPADLLPNQVDLNRLVFFENTKHRPTEHQVQADNQFVNLVSSNVNALSLRSVLKSDHKLESYQNSLPTLVMDNVFENDLTNKDQTIKSNVVNDAQTFTNYFPESDSIVLMNNLRQVIPTLKLDKNSQNQFTNQLNQKLKKHINNQINQQIVQQRKSVQSLNTISQLDSKINLNDILDQLNVLMGSNYGYMRRRQRRIIRKNPGMLTALYQGLKLSLSECKYQFKDQYWNCPINRKVKGREMFGKILNRAYRETAYLTSIRSAGITFAITKACSDGLIRTCSCDYRQNVDYISEVPGQSLFNSQYSFLNENNPDEIAIKMGIDGIGGNAIQSNSDLQEYTTDYKWSGCSDNIRFAFKKTKLLLDSHLEGSTSGTRDNILIHNYETGRMAVKKTMILVCKCHGLSGLCTMRTCWRRLSSFRKVGNYLKDRYDSAVQVVPSNDGESLQPKKEEISQNSNQDLYYSDLSPDFCKADPQAGTVGTSGRQCDPDDMNEKSNSCDQLCCGRGHWKEIKIVKTNCNCRFQYCCEVTCDTCKKTVQVYECV